MSRGTATQSPHWGQEFYNAATKAGIVELKPSQVRRVMKGGKLVGIFSIDGSLTNDCFVVYDGTNVLARVKSSEMQQTIVDLASLHIGRQLKLSHLTGRELDVSSIQMKDEIGYARYAIMISPLGVRHV